MKHKRKKVEKMRGSKTHGYGSKKKHRGSGSRGGKGYAGGKKHMKSWIFRYERDHFGKRGFRSLKQRKMQPVLKSINLRDLEKLAGEKKEIVLKDFGYDKVIGAGEIKKPLVIRAQAFSQKALEKIEKAGGKAEKIE
jgi:large subunit ribosomal protein L15